MTMHAPSNATDRRRRRRTTVLFWVLAVIVTLAAVVYQRMIGPTRPVRGHAIVDGARIAYKLNRSHAGRTDHVVAIAVPDSSFRAELTYRRYPTGDPWTHRAMVYRQGQLTGRFPAQPSGGKVLYQVTLTRGETTVPLAEPLILRFRGSVPVGVLLPHALLMFIAMLWANRTGLEALRRNADPRRLGAWTLALLVLGGLVFGPLVQWFSFGQAWTGVPFGYDLTDNKTLIAVIVWILALLLGRRDVRRARTWILIAALVTLVIYSIPHSILGTELDYGTLPPVGGAAHP